MKILIIGSSSTIGRAIATRFRPYGEAKLAGRRGADFQLDIADCVRQPDIDDVFDAVIHVAADFGGVSNDDLVRAELVNAVGTLSVCRLAQHVRAKHLVLLSTVSATYQPEDPYYDIYALSKRHGEEVAIFFCTERRLPLTILRPLQVYDAAGGCRKHQKLLYAMADCAQVGHDIHIYGTHDARRNYIYLNDLAEICCRVVLGRHTGVFTCAHPQPVRLSEMANAAFETFGKGGAVKFIKDKPSLSDLPLVDDYSLYRQIQFWPTVNINDGFRRIKHHREDRS